MNTIDPAKKHLENETAMRILTYKTIALFLVFYLYCSPAAITLAKQNNKEKTAKNKSELQDIFPVKEDVLNTLDDDQQKWYRRFNEGVLFFDGWQCISRSIIAKYPTDKREEVKRFIQRIGILIGTEWSKDNDVRKIDSKQLDIWGDKLKDAIGKDNNHLTRVLAQIDNEVKTLLKE